jgi:nucleotide-binding universal stress UspA family protein
MFRKIMVPVDLAHLDNLAPALEEARRLAGWHGAELCYVGVTAPTPGPLAHNPAEFAAKLEAFAADESRKAGQPASAHTIVSHDPAVDLNKKLVAAIGEVGADLVVIGSHRPGWSDHLFSSHGGYVATHAPVSVTVIR